MLLLQAGIIADGRLALFSGGSVLDDVGASVVETAAAALAARGFPYPARVTTAL